MRSIRTIAMVIILLTLSACASTPTQSEISTPPVRSQGQIFLYGEQHGVEEILNQEFELWQDGYNNENMRHLFVELPYYTAEFLNKWMQADSDDILNEIYEDWNGSASYDPKVKEFYERIKSECPETIFHGTDVGHQYETTGERYLKVLKDEHLEDSPQYLLAQDAISQGEYFYEHSDYVYRENKMVENFAREFDRLNGENIMGIYGAAHTGLDAMEYTTGSIPCMANQLKDHYGDLIHSEDLSDSTGDPTDALDITEFEGDMEPIRMDTIEVQGKKYEAANFGRQDITWASDYAYREFWRLEDAYDDFKDYPKTGEILSCGNYPMQVKTGQVFVIDYTKTDGSIQRIYYRSDGNTSNDAAITEVFTVE